MRASHWIGIGWLIVAPMVASAQSRVEPGQAQSHTSACSLADAMATKLGFKAKLKHEVAQQNCQALAPTMSEADRKEFVRCCMKRLEGETAAAPAPKKHKKANPGI